ncbi:MAG: hypothetical protein WB542_18100, partial [Polaromonas sp.]
MSFIKFFMSLLLGEFFRCNFGGGGGSSSSSSSTTTNNTDKRIAVGDGGLAVSADSSSVSVNVMDGGIVKRALDTIDTSNAISGQGFSKLLDTATLMFNRSEGLIGQTQKSVADAYAQAQTVKAGTIDNKTIIVL